MPLDVKPEVPLSIYDRPGLSITNLLRGDVPASMQALFSPQELSPDQLKSMRSYILRGEKAQKNPILRAATELATNPLMWVGLAMWLGPWGKVASAKQLESLFREGGKYVKALNPFIGKSMSPLTGFRNLWGTEFWDALTHMVRKGSMFQHSLNKNADDAMEVFKKIKGRAITSKELKMAGAYADGMHTTKGWMQQHFKKHFGLDTPIAPYLQGAVEGDEALHAAALKLKDGLKTAGRKVFSPTLKNVSRLSEEMTEKGVNLIPDNYLPHVIAQMPMDVLPAEVRGGIDLKTLNFIIKEAQKRGPRGFAVRPRLGAAIPLAEDLDEIAEFLGPGMREKIEALVPRRVQRMTNLFRGYGKKVIEAGGAVPDQERYVQAVQTAMKKVQTPWSQRMQQLGYEKEVADKLVDTMSRMMLGRPDQLDELATTFGKAFGPMSRYSLNVEEAVRHYASAMAPTYAWHSVPWRGAIKGVVGGKVVGVEKPIGTFLDDIMQTSDKVTDWQRKVWTDELRPMVQGFKHPAEASRALSFKGMKQDLNLWLRTSPTAERLFQPFPEAKRWMLQKFSDARGSLSDRSIGGMITHAHHLAALGLNISPTSQNLLQNPITTLNITGGKAMIEGLGVITSRIPKYMRLLKSVKPEIAFKRTFPEYYKAVGYENLAQSIRAGDVATEGGKVLSAARGAWGKTQDMMMAPFAASEKFNRLLSFYSARQWAVGEGIKDSLQLAQFGKNMMMMTQFSGGLLGQPGATRGWWAPFRQFTHFPLRFSEFLIGAAGMGPEGKFTTGPLGKGIIGTTAMYTLAKELFNTDISAGLMFSALPNPTYEGAPFYPWPLVPPMVGVMGNIMQAVHSGDYSQMPKAAALMLPGGLAARKAYTSFSPRYADYQNRTPDGRIPVYNSDRALIGHYSTAQLVLRGLGLRPGDTAKEQELVGYLLKQRDKIREYRRDYLEAIVNNDTEKANSVNKAFVKKYPTLGPLQVKKSDIRAVKNRKTISRLNRVMQGFPVAYRGLFKGMVDAAALDQMVQDSEFDPSTLELYMEPTPTAQPSRPQSLGMSSTAPSTW